MSGCKTGGFQGPTSEAAGVTETPGATGTQCRHVSASQEQQKQQSDAGGSEWLLIHKHDFHSCAKSALTPTGGEDWKEEKKNQCH